MSLPNRQLDDYLDDALDPESRRRFDEALEADPALKERVVAQRAALALVRAAPPVPAPRHLAWLVQRRIRRRTRRRPAALPLLMGLEAAAGAIVIVLMAVWLAASPDLLGPAPAAPARARLSDADRALIERFATVESVGVSSTGGGLVVEVTLRGTSDEEALRDALRARGGAALEGAKDADAGHRVVRMGARPAPGR